MLYSYNSQSSNKENIIAPKKWVCIWLTTNPDIFMNNLNKRRIAAFRNNNILNKTQPFKLSVLYSSHLLNEKGLLDLEAFKKKLYGIDQKSYEQIDFVDLNSDQLTFEDDLEKLLFIIANEEIKYLCHGGNPASASDIIRLLKICRERGNYFDLDVCILRNQNYEEKDEIEPKILEKGLLHSQLNNDVIVTWLKKRTRILLEIQKRIYRNYIITNRANNIIESQRILLSKIIDDEFLYNESNNEEEILSNEDYELLKTLIQAIFSYLLKDDTKIFKILGISDEDIPEKICSKYNVINCRNKIQTLSSILDKSLINSKFKKSFNFVLDNLYKFLVVQISGPQVFPIDESLELRGNNFDEPARNIFEMIAFNQSGISKNLYPSESKIMQRMINDGLYSLEQPGEYSWGLSKKIEKNSSSILKN